MRTPVSSNEIAAYFRSRFPEISGDSLSRFLCSDEGIRLAKVFEQDVYPLVGRHLSVRNRFFFERSRSLLGTGKFDMVLSLGSGLSLLTHHLAGVERHPRYIDADIPEVIQNRQAKLFEMRGRFPPTSAPVEMLEADLEELARQPAGGLRRLIGDVKPLIILEGVSYYLSRSCLAWLFQEVEKFETVAFVFDYWPSSAEKSRTFQKMVSLFKQSITEDVKTTLSEEDLARSSGLKILEDIEIRDAERLFASDYRLTDIQDIVPARFRVLLSPSISLG
jgi:O-methyltransferase involved in polyketide biosynthesis